MLTASNAFHVGIYGRNPDERVLMLFNDPSYHTSLPTVTSTVMAWTDADLSVNAGLRIQESFNQNSELAIGQALASTMSCSIFNEHGLLTHYNVTQEVDTYGKDCFTYLGLKTDTAFFPMPGGANCFAFLRESSDQTTGGILITGHSEYPYVRINGEQALPLSSDPPAFPVKSILIDNNAVEGSAYILCLGENWGNYYGITWEYGDTWVEFAFDARDWATAANWTWESLMGTATYRTFSTTYWMYCYKYPQIAASNRGFLISGNIIFEHLPDGTVKKWEYLPLGVFRMEQPHVIDQYTCAFNAYDKMTLFDVDITEFLEDEPFPVSLSTLLDDLCEYCGVTNITGVNFINATITVNEAPSTLPKRPKGRDLLKLIAEAACSNAVMDRYGRLQLAWMNTSPGIVVRGSQTLATTISDYYVSQIDGTAIDVPQDEGDPAEIKVGTGDNVYYLSDNPIIYDGTTAQITARITNIHNRLSAMPTFRPAKLDYICDWSVCAGDSINLWYEPAGSENTTALLVPVYTQTIEYRGVARAHTENSGSAVRPTDALYGTREQGAIAALRSQQNRLKSQLERQAARSTTGYLLCTTAASTAAKEVSSSGLPLTAGRLYCVYFGNGNTAVSPTLSLNGSTAAPIVSCYGSSAITAADITAGMTALFIYTGAAWVLLNPAPTTGENRV